MWDYPQRYDVIVIGAGHAGCEAAAAASRVGARFGIKVLLLSQSLDTIGKMSCNPAVGGVAKGHMVREIDALGGLMARATDATGIQFRMLNASKGPSVWSPRAQADRTAYQNEMKALMEGLPISLMQGSVESLETDTSGRICAVTVAQGIRFCTGSVVLCTGTFLGGLMHIGHNSQKGGRGGEPASFGISQALKKLGLELKRLKTGTPPRLHARSINFSCLERQDGDPTLFFSYDDPPAHRLPQLPCYITYTSQSTKDIITKNLHRSPMYSGIIEGVGPRYCPSIEDKVVRFADKERHQVFLEPEGVSTQEYYVNGVSSSLPFDVQIDLIHSIAGLESAEIVRPAYAVEYDCVASFQVDYDLQCRKVPGLFFAGQINGTSGYEEAAGQGLVAGCNAARLCASLPPLILKRSQAYIGVMVDDLVSKGLNEPYRMFTSRAEHRLILRQDNADLRLFETAYAYGLIDDAVYHKRKAKKECIESECSRFEKTFVQGHSLAQILARPEQTYQDLLQEHPQKVRDLGKDINFQIEVASKYKGYIQRQLQELEKLESLDDFEIPATADFSKLVGLRNEAKETLLRMRPKTLGQAQRLSGLTPADVQMLYVYLK